MVLAVVPALQQIVYGATTVGTLEVIAAVVAIYAKERGAAMGLAKLQLKAAAVVQLIAGRVTHAVV